MSQPKILARKTLDAYPIGSIYMSLDSTSPADIFGGVWERLKDTFLLTAGDIYSAGSQGGGATHAHTTAGHTLTINEMPSHFHPGLYWYAPGNMSYVITLNDGTYGYRLGWSGKGGSTTEGAGRNEVGIHTGSIGDGASHSHGDTGNASNLPPYKVVYAWKRIS